MLKFFRRSKGNDSTSNGKNSKNSKQHLLPSTLENSCEDASAIQNNVKNKVKTTQVGNHLKNSSDVFVNVDRYTKEKSSRSEIVDLKGTEQKYECCNKNDPNRSTVINRSTNQHQHHNSELLQSFNPISKSREFFNEIMGKSRHANRNRNKNKDKHYKHSQRINQQKSNELQPDCQETRNCETFDTSYNKSNKNTENSKEILNFGYQITKSKNRSNLVMKYEDEDENENNEKDSGYSKIGGDDDVDCDGASDAKLCENRHLAEDADYKPNTEISDSDLQHQEHQATRTVGDSSEYNENLLLNESINGSEHKGQNLQNDFTDCSANTYTNDEVRKQFDINECDRDHYYTLDMGQENSKTPTNQYTGTEFNQNDQSNDHVPVLPKITIGDYSDQSANIINNDAEIFYDTESFDSDPFVANNQSCDDWHFITSESDQIDSDPYLSDIPTTVIDELMLSSNSSNNSEITSSCSYKKQTDSPDSGIELDSSAEVLIDHHNCSTDTDNYLQAGRETDLFSHDSSTDCDDTYLHDFDRYDHHHKEKKHIVIDSISLPDVVAESTGMGNSNSVKTVDHTEDHKHSMIIVTDHNDTDTRDLVNQEARYKTQIEEAQKTIFNTQTKINDLQSKIDSLENDLSVKSWNVDRLQAELQAAHTEDDCVRRRLKILEAEIISLKQKYSESEDDLNRRYEELETQHSELREKYQTIQSLASTLQTQLAFAQSDTEQCRLEKEQLRQEKETELKTLQESIEKYQQERKELEIKWQKEFEVLRTQNADREEHLLTDCEWQLRTMQKNCKEKVDRAQKDKSEAMEKASEIESKALEQIEKIQHLLPLEAEVKQLRGLTNEQRYSLNVMTEQMDDLKADLLAANKQLEEEIQNVRKIRLHCDNAISDKERQTIQKIEQVRGDVAVQWERRLLEEMTRLKNELELVYAEDRRDDLDKLQVEHLEEIKALTNRYDANEEELRMEINTLRENLNGKTAVLSELQTKTDAALLETRMHLERADTEYQCAMNREIDKREMLQKSLQDQFDKEKLEMEEKFRQRLGQVKDEFAKELANTTEEIARKHRKQLEQQWEQLIAEKEDALQAMETRHRIRLEEAENRIKDLEIQHQRDLKEINNNNDIERTTLESRDLQNSQEIEQLHRKCRCLTNLFEEMRMRYERRDPRPEDLREIAELRERCESQERDLRILTEQLREIQMDQETTSQQRKMKVIKKPPSKVIPTNCDVIYEENEERESPSKEVDNSEAVHEDNEDSEDDTSVESDPFEENRNENEIAAV